MSPIQQILLGAGASKDPIYVDDVFSTYLYKGNATNRSIVNGIDLAGEGGLVWTKGRGNAYRHRLNDTVRGAGQELKSDINQAESTATNSLTQFNSNGFNLGTHADVNQNNVDHVSWSFRKAKGFFDIVTYTGNQTSRDIAHNLGSVPGFIVVKARSNTNHWTCVHRYDTTKHLHWDLTNSAGSGSDYFGSAPTATHFNLTAQQEVNQTGITFVAYLFAGGESPAATARSVSFNGSGDYLLAASSSDFTMTGDFTMECWFKSSTTSGVRVILNGRGSASSGGPVIYTNGASLVFDKGTASVCTASNAITTGQWYHVAGTRSGNNWKLYLDGNLVASGTDSTSYSSSVGFMIGQSHHGNEAFGGQVSNVRLTKGQVLYTETFNPSVTPLTTTSQGATASNVKLLCCNNSSVTGSTVTSGTITTNGSPTANTDSPFDDPAAFLFGENKDQGIVKTGSYKVNSEYDIWNKRVVPIGWEPGYIFYKNVTASSNWEVFDSTRMVLGVTGDSNMLEINTLDQEELAQRISFSPTGFKERGWGNDGDTIIYLAIRRPDPYVGKPAEVGTDVFAMDTGNASSTIPTFDSGFPVDFMMRKNKDANVIFTSGTRITGLSRLSPTDNPKEVADSTITWDSNVGWGETGQGASLVSWMWRKTKGFDTVTYSGISGVQTIRHSLGRVPEMIWVKNRSDTTGRPWSVYHKGMNGGTDPEDYWMAINEPDGEMNNADSWNDTAPTAHSFTVGNKVENNAVNQTYVGMLFASVDGISKVGSYTGSTSTVTVTCGFQPRFILIKKSSANDNWVLFDTLRGIATGNDCYLYVNSTAAENCSYDVIDLISTGFTLPTTGSINDNNASYIFYAHA